MRGVKYINLLLKYLKLLNKEACQKPKHKLIIIYFSNNRIKEAATTDGFPQYYLSNSDINLLYWRVVLLHLWTATAENWQPRHYFAVLVSQYQPRTIPMLPTPTTLQWGLSVVQFVNSAW